jgi:RHH-type transcriptional regulator, proline utilization regulon repressor / proline dehydrogenase / delta 1-pyrroline-5-carboxylate dehydrogenase
MTGSTATALTIQRMLAAREGAIVPLIAETGGLNAMLVDSTALPEQVTDDVVTSAFMSAGQRCSALRLLFLQEEIADSVIEMIAGAMDELVIGDPANLQTDVGPVITAAAQEGLDPAHRAHAPRGSHHQGVPPRRLACPRQFRRSASHRAQSRRPADARGVRPDAARGALPIRPDAKVLAAIRATGYGLTLGVQTRLESFWREVFEGTSVGNTYVNRNMIGAVVGVQPFGGSGLSGTGPKAGGPHYLARFASERTLTVNTTATGGNAALLNLGT